MKIYTRDVGRLSVRKEEVSVFWKSSPLDPDLVQSYRIR